MFTYIVLYLVVYFQVLLLVFFYLYNYVGLANLQNYSISKISLFVGNYTNHINKFLLLFILMSGLPPVSFFFIKISFLIKIMPTISFLSQLIFFFNFLLGMFFYLQVLTTTNRVTASVALLQDTSKNTYFILENQKKEKHLKYFIFWYNYWVVASIHFLGICFFFDFYLIFSVIF